MRFLSLLMIVLLSMITSCKKREMASRAKVADNCSNSGVGCTEYAKFEERARDDDPGASHYRINNNKQYQYKVRGTRRIWCEIEDSVSEFRISESYDTVATYFVADGTLHKSDFVPKHNQMKCGDVTVTRFWIISDTQKWDIISGPGSKKASIAGLTNYGHFVLWKDGDKRVYQRGDDIMDFEVNRCYSGGSDSLVFLLIKNSGNVVAVKGDFSEKLDEDSYSTIQDFMSRNNVCR